jgi:hypothetical protein
VEGGHETHVHDSWFGEYGWGEAGGHGHQNITGVALEIAGQVYYSMPNAVCESVHSAPCLSLALECKSASRWFCFPLSLS